MIKEQNNNPWENRKNCGENPGGTRPSYPSIPPLWDKYQVDFTLQFPFPCGWGLLRGASGIIRG